MRRGDIVTVAATGDYGEPRPAAIVRATRSLHIARPWWFAS